MLAHAIRGGLAATLVLLGTVAFAHAAEFALLKFDGRYVKWGSQEIGRGGVTITYAYVPHRMTIANARNCKEMVPFDALLERAGISQEGFQRQVDQALAMWTAVADVHFRQVQDVTDANILIGAQAQPEGTAFADVRPVRGDTGPVAAIAGASVCLNPFAAWRARPDGNKHTFDIRYVIAHEIGHTLGLDHPGRRGQLMAYSYDEEQRELGPGDVAGAVALYGPSRTLLSEKSAKARSRTH